MTSHSRIVLLNLSTGQAVNAFDPPTISAEITSMKLSKGRLFIGGDFATIGTETRRALATLDPSTVRSDEPHEQHDHRHAADRGRRAVRQGVRHLAERQATRRDRQLRRGGRATARAAGDVEHQPTPQRRCRTGRPRSTATSATRCSPRTCATSTSRPTASSSSSSRPAATASASSATRPPAGR